MRLGQVLPAVQFYVEDLSSLIICTSVPAELQGFIALYSPKGGMRQARWGWGSVNWKLVWAFSWKERSDPVMLVQLPLLRPFMLTNLSLASTKYRREGRIGRLEIWITGKDILGRSLCPQFGIHEEHHKRSLPGLKRAKRILPANNNHNNHWRRLYGYSHGIQGLSTWLWNRDCNTREKDPSIFESI